LGISASGGNSCRKTQKTNAGSGGRIIFLLNDNILNTDDIQNISMNNIPNILN